MIKASGSLLSFDDIKEALPFRISDRRLRQKIRASGFAIVHGRQLALKASEFEAFIDKVFGCSNSKGSTKSAGSLTAISAANDTEKLLKRLQQTQRKNTEPRSKKFSGKGSRLVGNSKAHSQNALTST